MYRVLFGGILEENVVFAINEPKLSELYLNLLTKVDNFNETFDKLDAKFSNLNQYLKGDILQYVTDKYDILKKQRTQLRLNLKNNAEDLNEVINKVKAAQTILSSDIDGMKHNIQEKENLIEEVK